MSKITEEMLNAYVEQFAKMLREAALKYNETHEAEKEYQSKIALSELAGQTGIQTELWCMNTTQPGLRHQPFTRAKFLCGARCDDAPDTFYATSLAEITCPGCLKVLLECEQRDLQAARERALLETLKAKYP